MVDKKLTADELRELARQADWKETCTARVARQKERIVGLKKKIAARQNALKEAESMLKAAESDASSGPPDGWEKPRPKPGGKQITVPTGTLKAEGK